MQASKEGNLDIVKYLVEKYNVNIEGFIWEIDEFLGENEGLTIAEIELKSAEQVFPKPEWIGEEVTGDVRYYNANLVKKPFKSW